MEKWILDVRHRMSRCSSKYEPLPVHLLPKTEEIRQQLIVFLDGTRLSDKLNESVIPGRPEPDEKKGFGPETKERSVPKLPRTSSTEAHSSQHVGESIGRSQRDIPSTAGSSLSPTPAPTTAENTLTVAFAQMRNELFDMVSQLSQKVDNTARKTDDEQQLVEQNDQYDQGQEHPASSQSDSDYSYEYSPGLNWEVDEEQEDLPFVHSRRKHQDDPTLQSSATPRPSTDPTAEAEGNDKSLAESVVPQVTQFVVIVEADWVVHTAGIRTDSDFTPCTVVSTKDKSIVVRGMEYSFKFNKYRVQHDGALLHPSARLFLSQCKLDSEPTKASTFKVVNSLASLLQTDQSSTWGLSNERNKEDKVIFRVTSETKYEKLFQDVSKRFLEKRKINPEDKTLPKATKPPHLPISGPDGGVFQSLLEPEAQVNFFDTPASCIFFDTDIKKDRSDYLKKCGERAARSMIAQESVELSTKISSLLVKCLNKGEVDKAREYAGHIQDINHVLARQLEGETKNKLITFCEEKHHLRLKACSRFRSYKDVWIHALSRPLTGKELIAKDTVAGVVEQLRLFSHRFQERNSKRKAVDRTNQQFTKRPRWQPDVSKPDRKGLSGSFRFSNYKVEQQSSSSSRGHSSNRGSYNNRGRNRSSSTRGGRRGNISTSAFKPPSNN